MSTFPTKILVATDGSEDAALAARAAVDLAAETGAELHVVHVGPSQTYPPPAGGPPPPTSTDQEREKEARKILDYQVSLIEEAGGEVAEAHVRLGSPAEEILHVSEEIVAGLIVVGNQGLGGRFGRVRRFLMGSVSETVLRYARCSAMVVRRDLYDHPPG